MFATIKLYDVLFKDKLLTVMSQLHILEFETQTVYYEHIFKIFELLRLICALISLVNRKHNSLEKSV